MYRYARKLNVLPSFAATTTYDVQSVLEAMGSKHIYVGEEVKVDVTLDGVISPGEYTTFPKIQNTIRPKNFGGYGI